jgi:hypothetical protein
MLTVASNAQITLVNAAFLQEVKDSNLRLWSVLRELRDLHVGQSDPRELSRELVQLLGELRDAIALEFSLEETYGFIEGGARIGGIGMPDAALAKIQHRELYLQLHELCEQVEEAQYRGTISRDLADYVHGFERFDLALRAHEEFEAELIRCAFGIRPLRGQS